MSWKNNEFHGLANCVDIRFCSLELINLSHFQLLG